MQPLVAQNPLNLGVLVASFLIWGLTEGEPTSGVYVAPHLEHGKVVPGHVEKGP